MKKQALFGMGAALLMVLLTAAPAVYGTPSGTTIGQTEMKDRIMQGIKSIPIHDGTLERFVAVFQLYAADIAEIETYVQNYIAQHGGIDANFTLPSDLETKYNTIVHALQEAENPYHGVEVNQQSGHALPLGGGINRFEVSFFFDWPGLGLLYKLWLDHTFTTYIKYLGPLGVGFVALLISVATAGTAAPYAIAIAVLLIGFGITFVVDYDHGGGIFVQVKNYLLPPLPPFIDYIASQ